MSKRPIHPVRAIALWLTLTMVFGSLAFASDTQEGALPDWPAIQHTPPVSELLVMQAEARAEQILSGLTLDQKIGQITQGELQVVRPYDIARYCLGSVLSGGGSWPYYNKHAEPEVWRDVADAYWEAGMDGCGIPPVWGIDSVHGNSNVVGATLFPHNIGLGAANNPDLVREIGRVTARETRATGQSWVFAPTVAVARDDRWGRTYESYSEDPARVARLARATIEGLQGDLGECNVAATMKHWIGDGGTTGGRDQGDTAVSEAELINIHGLPYFAAMEAGVLSAMASYSSWNGEKVHGSQYLVTDVLKNRLGFSGHVISDWNAIGQVPTCTIFSCPKAVNAGIDMFMVPHHWRAFIALTKRQVAMGIIPIERIDDAVRRILRNKILLGLFEQRPSESACAVDSELGAADHRALARAAVRESLVLLKNNRGLLPLSRDARVLVTGKSADNIANQSGGWTLTWQGVDNTNDDFPGATSIYDAIAAIVPQADLAEDLTGVDLAQYDVVIAAIGETPYAEFLGDIGDDQTLEHARLHPEDIELLRSVDDAGVPLVTLWIAGRPLYTNQELNRSDAFVAAWLPGSEGGGIADVLFAGDDGNVNHDFSGTLAFSWPAADCQTPVNVGQDYGAEIGSKGDLVTIIGNGAAPVLFPYGYGLTYQDAFVLGPLGEHSEAAGCGERSPARREGDIATPETLLWGGTIAP